MGMNTGECSWHDKRVLEYIFRSLLNFFITSIKEETFWQPTFEDEVVVPELPYRDSAFDENDSILDVYPLEDGSESNAWFREVKAEEAGHPPQPPAAPQPPVVPFPPCPSTTVVAIAFPLTQAVLQGCGPHPQASIVTEAHGAHLTLLSIFQQTFPKMVNTFGAFGLHGGPLEARVAQQRHIFSLQGHGPPNSAVTARIFMARDHDGLERSTHQGALGPPSPASMSFCEPSRDWYCLDNAWQYQGKIPGVVLTRGGYPNGPLQQILHDESRSARDPKADFSSAAAALRDRIDPAWVATIFCVSPRGIQLSMEHRNKGEKLLDMGNLGQLLTTQPDWALKVDHSMGQHTTQRRHKVAAFERDERRQLGKCGWWKPLEQVAPLPTKTPAFGKVENRLKLREESSAESGGSDGDHNDQGPKRKKHLKPKNAKKARTKERPPNKTEKNATTPGVARSFEPNSRQLNKIYLN